MPYVFVGLDVCLFGFFSFFNAYYGKVINRSERNSIGMQNGTFEFWFQLSHFTLRILDALTELLVATLEEVYDKDMATLRSSLVCI